MGKPATTNGYDAPETLPPIPPRQFTDLAKHVARADEPAGLLVLAPEDFADEVRLDSPPHIGPYNRVALAENAIGETAALSADYVRTFIDGLRDVLALRSLPEPSKRRR